MLEEEKLKLKAQFADRQRLLEDKFRVEHEAQMHDIEHRLKMQYTQQ